MPNDNKDVEAVGGCYCRVLTHEGWVNISTIEIGDKVIGSDGKLVMVANADTGSPQDCIELKFNDGTYIYVDNLTELNLTDPDDKDAIVKYLAIDLLGEIHGDQREKYQFPALSPYKDDHESSLPVPPTIFMHLLMKEGHEESPAMQEVFTYYGMKKYNDGIRYIPASYVYKDNETRQEIFNAVTTHLDRDEFGNPIGLIMPSRTMALSFVELARFLGYVCTSAPIEDATKGIEYSNAVANLTPRLISFFNKKKLTSIMAISGMEMTTLLLDDENSGFLTDAHILIKPYTV